MLKEQIRRIIEANPEYAAITPVIEKEILHHDIMSVMIESGVKFIALAYRSRRIKPRDIWDIAWIKQRGTAISNELIDKKLSAREKQRCDFEATLKIQIDKLMTDDEVRKDFNNEMSRFIPQNIKERTIDNPDYWNYLRNEIGEMSKVVLGHGEVAVDFNMGM